MCPACRHPLADCACHAKPAILGDGVVRVSRQKRAGKTVTLVKGLALDAAALVALGKQLRTACGSGGTVKDGVIEVQGDHCDLLMDLLTQQGHRPKRAEG
jgi:translation initiation factor 1